MGGLACLGSIEKELEIKPPSVLKTLRKPERENSKRIISASGVLGPLRKPLSHLDFLCSLKCQNRISQHACFGDTFQIRFCICF